MATLTDVARTSQDVFLNANKNDSQTTELGFNFLRDTTNGYFIKGWTGDWKYLEASAAPNGGGILQIFGNDSPYDTGIARLRSTDHSTYWHDLNVRPDGQLTFDNQHVCRLQASWSDGNSWYRLYSDGLLINGRAWIDMPECSKIWCGFAHPYNNNWYCVVPFNGCGKTAADAEGSVFVAEKETTGFNMSAGWLNPNTSSCGFLAIGWAW